MGWLVSGLQSVSDWLAPASDAGGTPPPQDLETIRTAMLTQLLRAGAPEPRLSARIRVAADTQALWYLRPGLMDALCRHLGEPRAAAALAEVTALFGKTPAGRPGMRTGPVSSTLGA